MQQTIITPKLWVPPSPAIIRDLHAMSLFAQRHATQKKLTASAYSPLDLGVKLRAWWDFIDTANIWQNTDATGAVSSDTDPVGRVSDKSGNGKHIIQATGGNKPAYRTGPARVVFDGSNDALLCASAAFATDDFESFAVLAETATPADDRWIWTMAGSSGYSYSHGPSLSFGNLSTEIVFRANSDSMYCAKAGTGAVVKALYEGSKTATTSTLNINGTSIATDNSFTDPANPHTGPFAFGSGIGPSGGINAPNSAAVAAYEMIITAALTSDERTALRNYMYAKHGITP